MFSIRLTYFPNCVALVRERWANLPVSFETDIDGDWRVGRGSLSVVDSFCRRRGLVLSSIVEVRGSYTLSFNGKEEAAFAVAEDVWREHQEARWATG